MFKKIKKILSSEETEKTQDIEKKTNTNKHKNEKILKINNLLKFGSYIKKNTSLSLFDSFLYKKETIKNIDINYFTLNKEILSFIYILKTFVALPESKLKAIKKDLDNYGINFEDFLSEYKKYIVSLQEYILKIDKINFEEFIVIDDELQNIIEKYLENKNSDNLEKLLKKYQIKTVIDNFGNEFIMLDYEAMLNDNESIFIEKIKSSYITEKSVYDDKFILLVKKEDND